MVRQQRGRRDNNGRLDGGANGWHNGDVEGVNAMEGTATMDGAAVTATATVAMDGAMTTAMEVMTAMQRWKWQWNAWETTMATTIALPAAIELSGATLVLVFHRAELTLPPPMPATDLMVQVFPSSPVPSTNVPMHAPSNATNTPTYASLSLV